MGVYNAKKTGSDKNRRAKDKIARMKPEEKAKDTGDANVFNARNGKRPESIAKRQDRASQAEKKATDTGDLPREGMSPC